MAKTLSEAKENI
jgi:hypothetical protein